MDEALTTTIATTTSATTAAMAEVLQLLEPIAKAGNDNDWALTVAGILTLLVFVVRKTRLMKNVPPEWVPYVTLGTAMALSMSASLAAGASLLSAVTTGLVIGLSAIGGWETIGKLIRRLSKGQ